ncbi:MAG TPA: CRISPR-associated endonuclease Cas3'' [Acidimicrobiales bacterium]|nr:CRISPR-associated endonuclease Cas3'' [Acidimicrobiales bacterium]
MSGLWAHTPNQAGCPHALVDHLRGTANLARRFGEAFGCSELASEVGLVHDLGKAGGCFQDYLRLCHDQGDSVARSRYPARDHKSAGARLLWGPTTAGLLGALAVFGHHGGLPSLADLRARMQPMDPDASEALAQVVIGSSWEGLKARVPEWAAMPDDGNLFDVEMLGRFLQSALADADFLDTAAHFGRAAVVSPARVDELVARAEDGHDKLVTASTTSAVNRARQEAYEEALAGCEGRPGWYELAGVTGIGKTAIGLSWALHHAAANNLRRVVTAVPYITVTSQTASFYRELLGVDREGVVLEHHSRVGWAGVWAKLAAENWDAPVVVTTTVRLFESLFGRRPSDVRRLHRLARSVVVLDEAHTLPVRLLDALYDALRCLVERFGVSVLVMSATPPAIERVRTVAGRRPAPLLADPYRWPALRARVAWSGPVRLDHAGLAGMVGSEPRVLCVLNTARDAAEVARLCRQTVVYLARTLRPAEVDERLADVRRSLAEGVPCRVVATQLVEAGVDLDFPVVIRVLGPAPSLEQAAGRCNREGKLSKGRATVVDLDRGRLPPDDAYAAGMPITRGLLAEGVADLGDPNLSRAWFERLLSDPAVRTDRDGVQRARRSFDYPEVERLVRLVDDEGVGVIVPWPPGEPRAEGLGSVLRAAGAGRPLDPVAARHLQDVTVNIRPWLANRARTLDFLPADPEALQVWTGPYDPLVGIDPSSLQVAANQPWTKEESVW